MDVPSIEHASLRRLNGRCSRELADLCAECTDFFELVHGEPGGEATAHEILGPLPSHLASGHKHVFGLYRHGRMEGVVELLEGYPSATEWCVGLFVLRPSARSHGLGTSVWRGLRAWIFGRGASTVRLLVQEQNPRAREFWERHGFQVEGDVLSRSTESSAWKLQLSMESAAQPAAAADRELG